MVATAARRAAVTGAPPAEAAEVAWPAGRRLLGLTWAHLLNDGAANYLPGVLPAILVSLHEPLRIAGVLVAALAVGQTLQPVSGWVADRLGGRGLVLAGLTLSSLGGGLLGFVHATWLLVAVLVPIGLGSSLFHPQALGVVYGMVGERRGLRTSLFLVGGELGRGIWPTVASLVVANLGLEYLWLVAVPGLVTAAFVPRWAPRLPRRPGRGERIRWRRHARSMAVLVGYRSVRALTTFGLVAFVPLLWHVRGGSLVTGASILTTMVVVGVVGNLGGGHLADRVGKRPVLVLSAIGTAAFIVPLVELRGPWVWLAAGPLGIALFLSASTTVLIGQDLFPENRSMGSGIALGMAGGIGALLVLVLGLWVDARDVLTVFWVLAGLSAASGALALAFPAALMS